MFVVICNQVAIAENSECDIILNKANQWCAREKIKHFTASALNRTSLYEPFVYMTSKLTPPPNKSGFTPLSMGRKVIKDSSWIVMLVEISAISQYYVLFRFPNLFSNDNIWYFSESHFPNLRNFSSCFIQVLNIYIIIYYQLLFFWLYKSAVFVFSILVINCSFYLWCYVFYQPKVLLKITLRNMVW